MSSAREADASLPVGAEITFEAYCPDCGYNLRGLRSRRCPECGLPLDFLDHGESLIPWSRRAQIGRWRAYIRTVIAATFRTQRFCRETARPVNYPDAVRFRRITLCIALASLLITLGIVETAIRGPLQSLAAATVPWLPAVVIASAFLALVVLTGVPSDLFRDKHFSIEQQNRATVLSYYGCAPLALAPLVPVCVLCGWLLLRGRYPTDAIVNAFAATVWLLPLLGCWFTWGRMAEYTSHRTARRWRVLLLTALLWLVLTPVMLVGIPLLALWLAVVAYSLR